MDKDRPSITAENIAAVRAFESQRPPRERLFNDAYACRFLSARFTGAPDPAGYLSRILDSWEIIVPGVCGSIIARTRFIDECLIKAIGNRIEQLVILGAGYDSRALRFKALKDKVKVFEVDHPGTQACKLKRLETHSAVRDQHVTYIPVDFEAQDFGKALLDHGYNTAAHTFFIWEGVTYYLSAKIVEATLSFVAKCSPAGSEIVFDYFPASLVAGGGTRPESQPLIRILKNLGEQVRFGIAPEEIGAFLGNRGFRLIQNLTSEDYEKAYFKGKTGKGRTVSNLFVFVHAAVA